MRFTFGGKEGEGAVAPHGKALRRALRRGAFA